MKRVYKYEIDKSIEKISMPFGAKILSAQIQKDKICLWAEVDTENETTQRAFIIFGTGHDINFKNDEISYLATVQQGIFVWHIYEYIGDLTTASF